VCYWISFRFPGGKQRRERVGYSIAEARDAEGKRRSQKRENRIFDIVPEAKMTFTELAKWYVNLKSVAALRSYDRVKGALNQFNTLLGDRIVNSIKTIDLEDYQVKRTLDKKAPATIDMEISIAKTMITKAFDNEMVGGHTLRAFKKVKKLLKRNANARDRVLSIDECKRLIALLPPHTRVIIGIAIYTGMRKSEILSLTWDKVDLKSNIIRLESTDTKDREPRKIPISEELYGMFNNIPRAIHNNHVILYNGKPIRDIREALRTACRNVGIAYGRFVKGGFVFHDTRHTFNTNMRKAGVAQSVIMKITGHSTSEMFDRYNTVDEDDIRKAADQMGRFLKSVDQSVDQDPEKILHRKQ
jgi:integrase